MMKKSWKRVQQFFQSDNEEVVPSEKKLGKWKVTHSDEEVAQEIEEKDDHDSANEEEL